MKTKIKNIFARSFSNYSTVSHLEEGYDNEREQALKCPFCHGEKLEYRGVMDDRAEGFSACFKCSSCGELIVIETRETPRGFVIYAQVKQENERDDMLNEINHFGYDIVRRYESCGGKEPLTDKQKTSIDGMVERKVNDTVPRIIDMINKVNGIQYPEGWTKADGMFLINYVTKTSKRRTA